MFLGHVITQEGIRVYPKKIKSLFQLCSPWTVKEVQGLNGKLAAFRWFLAKSTEKTLPFYKSLKMVFEEKRFQVDRGGRNGIKVT